MGLTISTSLFAVPIHISELWTLSLDLDGRSKASTGYESKPGALLNVGMLISKMMSKMLISWFLTDPQIMLINLTKRGLAMSPLRQRLECFNAPKHAQSCTPKTTDLESQPLKVGILPDCQSKAHELRASCFQPSYSLVRKVSRVLYWIIMIPNILDSNINSL